MVALKGACRNYDALWYCLARCRDVGSYYNIFFFCSVLFWIQDPVVLDIDPEGAVVRLFCSARHRCQQGRRALCLCHRCAVRAVLLMMT